MLCLVLCGISKDYCFVIISLRFAVVAYRPAVGIFVVVSVSVFGLSAKLFMSLLFHCGFF